MDEIKSGILSMAVEYFQFMGEDVPVGILGLLLDAAVGQYQTIRDYPASYSEEAIAKDTESYFSRRKADFAMKVLPKAYGQFGAEGLESLEDNTIDRNWFPEDTFADVARIARIC